MEIIIRELMATDGTKAGEIFYAAIQEGTKDHYDQAQRNAWAGETPTPDRWATRLDGVFGFAAEMNGEMIGFMTLDDEGYIDLAFVHPKMIGKGVGQKLYCAIEAKASKDQIPCLATHASKKALPFFSQLGFEIEAEQEIERSGTKLTNYRMFKKLI